MKIALLRIVAEDPNHRLKKDMYVTATLHAGVIENALPNAVVAHDTENQPFVYVQTTANQFARRSVTLGDSFGSSTQITPGWKDGERVVGDGSPFLRFQSSLQD